jgi:hypothetical protein
MPPAVNADAAPVGAERVLAVRKVGGGFQYEVKWHGHEETSWVLNSLTWSGNVVVAVYQYTPVRTTVCTALRCAALHPGCSACT